MIPLLVTIASITTPHTAARLTFESAGIGIWTESEVYVCRGQTLWVFDYQGARMGCGSVVKDEVFSGGFEK